MNYLNHKREKLIKSYKSRFHTKHDVILSCEHNGKKFTFIRSMVHNTILYYFFPAVLIQIISQYGLDDNVRITYEESTCYCICCLTSCHVNYDYNKSLNVKCAAQPGLLQFERYGTENIFPEHTDRVVLESVNMLLVFNAVLKYNGDERRFYVRNNDDYCEMVNSYNIRVSHPNAKYTVHVSNIELLWIVIESFWLVMICLKKK